MAIEHLLAFNVALIAAVVSPGPALLVAIRTTLEAGRPAGIAIGCGLGLVAAGWTMMALLGLEGIFRLVPWGYTAVKTAGALYLIYIAVGTWRNARTAVAAEARPARGVRRAVRDGALINLLNPKSVLFAAAVLVVIFPAGMSGAEMGVVVANHLAVEIVFYSALAWVMSTDAVRRRYLAAKLWLDRATALVLGALGLRLLLDR